MKGKKGSSGEGKSIARRATRTRTRTGDGGGERNSITSVGAGGKKGRNEEMLE